MLTRQLQVPSHRSCWIFGPRQTGKTTLVQSVLPPNAISLNLLHQDLALRFAKDPGQFRREVEAALAGGADTVFLDEIQKVPELLDEVHALIERGGVRFILTGSSARKLKRGNTNLLAGRAVTRRLHPLTLSEQGDHFDLERTLRLGSLPPVVTRSDEDAIDLLKSYALTYLREEVQAESLVRNLGGFGRFLDVAAAQSGEILNYSAVGRDAALATRTVQSYFEILEDTLLGFRLEAWRKSPRSRMVGHSRFYIFDTGVTSALNHRLTAPMDPFERGRLFEQWLILECRKLIDYNDDEARLYYWRTNSGTEVDLLVEKHGSLRLAVEIKAKSRVVGADLGGLRSFGQVHPGVPRVAVSTVPEPYEIEGIRVLPCRDFLEEFTGWL